VYWKSTYISCIPYDKVWDDGWEELWKKLKEVGWCVSSILSLILPYNDWWWFISYEHIKAIKTSQPITMQYKDDYQECESRL
jgi:hypothetical protein